MQYKFTDLAKKLMESSKSFVEGWGDTEYKSVLDFTPRKATKGSNGFDLFACIEEEITLLAGESAKIGSGVHVWAGSLEVTRPFRESYKDERTDTLVAGFLMPKSSIKGCMLTNAVGLIDDDYQGECIMTLWNRTDEPLTIKPGQSLVQLVFILTVIPVLELVQDFDLETGRGQGGFGSTGNHT